MEKAIDQLLGQGVLGTLLVLSLLVCAFLFKEMQKKDRFHRKEIEEMLSAREEASKQRIEDGKTLVLALEQSSRSNVALENSVKERSVAVQELSRLVATLAAQVTGAHDRIMEHLRNFERRMESIDRELERALRDSGTKA